MATLLETYLADKDTKKVSKTIAIVGTDKSKFSPLLDLYKAMAKPADGIPDCLSAYLKNKNIGWSKPNNDAWIKLVTKTAPVETFYVAHGSIIDGLNAASKLGPLTKAAFIKAYKGRTNDSYDEVCAILDAGYTKLADSGIAIVSLKGKHAATLSK